MEITLASVLLLALGGVGFGVAVSVLLYERALTRAARWHRSGNAETVQPGSPRVAVTANPEAQALRHINADSVKRGADELQAISRSQGHVLSRKEAEAQARDMLYSNDPIGGVV